MNFVNHSRFYGINHIGATDVISPSVTKEVTEPLTTIT
jgi:hypothetical protein